jgi:hypothetical protein
LCSVIGRAAVLTIALALAGCGARATKGSHASDPIVPHAHPQAIEPRAGEQPALAGPRSDPVGDVHAHAPPLSEVRKLLTQAKVYAKKTNATYIDPLQYVTHWERTDQGVDATMPIGAPILAPGPVKILAIIPNWYAGQPLVYWELLNGPEAGRIQYVAEQITSIAPPGSYLQQGQVIARYAAHGTAIEFGWSTINGVTLAQSTTGYVEGQVTPAGRAIRAWLNALGANAGPS